MRIRRRRTTAQTITEYMLIISVVVIALTAAVYRPMNAAYDAGSKGWTDRQKQDSSNGYVGQGERGERR